MLESISTVKQDWRLKERDCNTVLSLYCMWEWQDVPWGCAMGDQGSAERVCGSLCWAYDCQACMCQGSHKAWPLYCRKATHIIQLLSIAKNYTSLLHTHNHSDISLVCDLKINGQIYSHLVTNHNQVFKRVTWLYVFGVILAGYNLVAGTRPRKTLLEIPH